MRQMISALALAALSWGCDAKASSEAATPPPAAAPPVSQEASTTATVKIDDV